jgi:hypothetical protein
MTKDHFDEYRQLGTGCEDDAVKNTFQCVGPFLKTLLSEDYLVPEDLDEFDGLAKVLKPAHVDVYFRTVISLFISVL